VDVPHLPADVEPTPLSGLVLAVVLDRRLGELAPREGVVVAWPEQRVSVVLEVRGLVPLEEPSPVEAVPLHDLDDPGRHVPEVGVRVRIDIDVDRRAPGVRREPPGQRRLLTLDHVEGRRDEQPLLLPREDVLLVDLEIPEPRETLPAGLVLLLEPLQRLLVLRRHETLDALVALARVAELEGIQSADLVLHPTAELRDLAERLLEILGDLLVHPDGLLVLEPVPLRLDPNDLLPVESLLHRLPEEPILDLVARDHELPPSDPVVPLDDRQPRAAVRLERYTAPVRQHRLPLVVLLAELAERGLLEVFHPRRRSDSLPACSFL
jgi:hypothetical protein